MTESADFDGAHMRPNRRTSRGAELLHDPMLNKGTAFTEEERDRFGLRGMLPPRVLSQEQQVERALANVRQLATPLDRYLYLTALQDRNERLFYRVLTENLAEFLPIVYTPTVGEACRMFARIFRRPRGLYVSLADRGRVRSVLANWPYQRVRVIVVTDGERILGLGDLGANGMGIPIGKLALYTACAGIDPSETLPVVLDVGTNNADLLADPLYIGLQRQRAKGGEYDALVEEFVDAVGSVFPGVLLQFEDFATDNAVRLLARYRERLCAFNDDIQGTAAITLAALMSASRVSGRALADQTILFVGAGAAAVGIADLCTLALTREGLTSEQARARVWLYDSQGLVTSDRASMAAHKRPYARPHAPIANLAATIEAVRPSALIGVSAQGGVFTADVLQAMARLNDRPIVFALSNPTANSECTARDAYEATQGRAVFASGSPFAPVTHAGRTYAPSQANNVYVFPGVGLAVLGCQATRITDDMFLAAARAIAARADAAVTSTGALFPPLDRIAELSLDVAVAVAEVAYAEKLAQAPRSSGLRASLAAMQFDPRY